MAIISFTEKNIHGAWVVFGIMGIRRYYGYTKVQAESMYREEYERTHVVNVTK
jgi:hypothetical protein